MCTLLRQHIFYSLRVIPAIHSGNEYLNVRTRK